MIDAADIVIVGAGAAGTGAARRLAELGVPATVLDALPRKGGRAWTLTVAGLPHDLGCGWLHSGERNPWTRIAEAAGAAVERRPAAWGNQFRDLGFSAPDRAAAGAAFADWSDRLRDLAPGSDRAADALESGNPWTPYIQALSGYISGDELERISAADYIAYDDAASDQNWRLPAGYGALVAASLPQSTRLFLETPVSAIGLDGRSVMLSTPSGTLRARAVILTVSTHVLSGGAIAMPPALDPWRHAAARLPLGDNEKLLFEIVGDGPFAPETHVIGNPRDAATGSYYIRPFGRPIIECFLGGAGARAAAAKGPAAAFARATDQLAGLFGADVRRHLRPLVASDWAGTVSIGGGYSHALPGEAARRNELARPFDDRIFFAGEATDPTDFSTAHGAYASGVRAAEEACAALGLPPDRARAAT